MKALTLTGMLLLMTGGAFAQGKTPAGSPGPSRSAVSPAAVAPAASARLPEGHPPTAPASLPDGHPPTSERPQEPEGPTPDQVGTDPELAVGTIFVHLVDALDRPLGGAPIVLDIDKNTVAQGESHDERTTRVDAKGEVRFEGLKLGSGTSYRVRTQKDDATFASSSFTLKEEGGAQVLLHSYDVLSNLAESRFVIEAFVILEVKQDTVRINHLLRTYTFGPAFLARGLKMKLPPGARAFNQEQSSSDVVLREQGGEVTLEGTFPPGQQELTYAYTVPLEPNATLELDLPLPPRVLAAQVSVNAGPGMSLEVAGFAPAQLSRRRDGQKVLQALRQIDAAKNPSEFLANVANGEVNITVRGLPERGNGPVIAAGLAALALMAGAGNLRKSGSKAEKADLQRDLAEARDALLSELSALEAAKLSAEVGPKSYERLRVALLDALARILAKQNAP